MYLYEMCCKCGFVHKDERVKYRAYKPHYHWMPLEGEVNKDGLLLHATLCAECCSTLCVTSGLNWQVFGEQKSKTESKYIVPFSLNAPLPDIYMSKANSFYAEQVKFFLNEYWGTEVRK
jgi:hypothetical protein